MGLEMDHDRLQVDLNDLQQASGRLRRLAATTVADLKSVSRDAASTTNGWPGSAGTSATATLSSFDRRDASLCQSIESLADALAAAAHGYGGVEEGNRASFDRTENALSEKNDDGNNGYDAAGNA